MSEFSESYHLKTENQNDGIALLKRANLYGFVFPSENNWVTLVAENSEFIPNQSIVDANEGLLLHYVYAEDHGWSFTLFEGKVQLCHYACDWDDEIETTSQLDLTSLKKILKPECQQMTLQEFEAKLEITEDGFEESEKVATLFAEMIGLTNYEWLSYDYAEKTNEKVEGYEKVIRI